MGEHKNTIIAIALSLVVMVGWQIFIAYPQMEKQRKQDALKQQEQSQVQPGQAQPGQAQSGQQTQP
ncbi:MAG: membrane protein insertase YidC, partial [Xanthobacteraceae bacterium]